MLMENQKDTWDNVAKGWHNFKRKPFPKTIHDLSGKWAPGKILDLGCGNGRNLMPFSEKKFECHGVDFSVEMLINAKRYFEENKLNAVFEVGEMMSIPYEDNYFDYVICVAAFHHLNKKDQMKTLFEIKRVLKKGGKVYFSVWNKWQNLEFMVYKKEKYVKWRTKEHVIRRYYYLFNLFELKNLLKRAGFKIETAFGMFDKNIEIICSC